MDTQSVWNELSAIPVGTIVAWASVIIAIVSAIWIAIMKLFKVFTKYRNLKDENEKQTKLLQLHDESLEEIRQELVKINESIHNDTLAQHDEILVEIKDWLSKVNDSLEEQREINYEYLKHSIVITCRRAIDRNSISAEELKSLEDMFREYVDIFHGNGYVKTLMKKTREVPVIGSIEE